MPGMAASSAVAEATMTESPMAVTWPPGTSGSRPVRHRAAGFPAGTGAGLAWAGEAVWEAALTRSPFAT